MVIIDLAHTHTPTHQHTHTHTHQHTHTHTHTNAHTHTQTFIQRDKERKRERERDSQRPCILFVIGSGKQHSCKPYLRFVDTGKMNLDKGKNVVMLYAILELNQINS